MQHVRHVPLLPIRDRGRSRSPRRRASLSNRVQPSGGAPDTPTQVVLRGWVHPESRGPQQPRLHRALLGTPTFNRNEIGLVRSPLSGLQMWGFPALLPQTKLDHLRASLPIDFPLRDREFQKLLMELQQLKEQSSGRLSLSWSSRSMNDRQHACEVISTSCQRARERTGTIPWLYMGATTLPKERWSDHRPHYDTMTFVNICVTPAELISMERFLIAWGHRFFPGRVTNLGPGGEHISTKVSEWSHGIGINYVCTKNDSVLRR